jgi:hypothetical protein
MARRQQTDKRLASAARWRRPSGIYLDRPTVAYKIRGWPVAAARLIAARTRPPNRRRRHTGSHCVIRKRLVTEPKVDRAVARTRPADTPAPVHYEPDRSEPPEDDRLGAHVKSAASARKAEPGGESIGGARGSINSGYQS